MAATALEQLSKLSGRHLMGGQCATALNDERFRPVAPLCPIASFDEAIKLANHDFWWFPYQDYQSFKGSDQR